MSAINVGDDFDWFATDASGATALFASAGQGFIPPEVAEYHVMHETVAGSIEYPHWGTDHIWDDAAALGLYVFDWSIEEDCYLRVATPGDTVDAALNGMISRISSLPVLTKPLSELRRVVDLRAFDALTP